MPTLNTSPTEYGDKGDAARATPPAEMEDESEIVNAIWSNFEKDKAYKFTIVAPADWKRYAMIYQGQHWSGNQKEWQSTPTIPLSTAAVNSLVPVVTDQRPQIAIVPRQPEDSKISNVLRSIIEWLWEENNCDIKLPTTELDSFIFGNGFWKVIWNPLLRGGLGDIQIVQVDPTCMFFNPEAKDIDDAERIEHVEQMSLKRIEMLWPEKGPLVTASVKDPNVVVDRPQQSQKGGGTKGNYNVQTTTGSDVWTYSASSATRQGGAPKDSATVCESWEFDKETKRWKRTVIADKIILEGPEITDLEMAPFIHFPDYKTNWSIWASGEIQLVENIQYEINKRRGMILDILRFCSSPMIVYDPGAGADIENMDIAPGVAIPAEGGPAALNWLLPNMDLSGLFAVGDRDKSDMNDILGNVEMIQGKNPTGVEAGVALEQLAEAANTRLRLKVRLMEAALRRCGKILIKFIQKHYTSQRIFRIVGSEFQPSGTPEAAGAAQFMTINKPAGMQQGPPNEMGEPTMEPTFDENSNFIPPDAEFDVRIGAGSTLPVSRTAKFQQAITLFDRGALPIRELLRSAGWDRWEEIASQMEAAQMAAQGMQPQGGGAMDTSMIPEDVLGSEEPPMAESA